MLRSKSLAILLILAVWTAGCSKRSENARKELEQLEIPYNATELVNRALQGDKHAVDLLLSAGMNPNARNVSGVTTLMYAAGGGYIEIVNVLLKREADVNAKSNDGWTALMYATFKEGNTEVVKALLTGGAHVNAKDNNGRTALMWAADQDHTTIVQLLKRAAAKE